MEGSTLEELLPLLPNIKFLFLEMHWSIGVVEANNVFGALPALCPAIKSFCVNIPLDIHSLSSWPVGNSLLELERLGTKHFLPREVLAPEGRDANYGRFFSQIKRIIFTRLPSLRHWGIPPGGMSLIEKSFMLDVTVVLYRRYGAYDAEDLGYSEFEDRMLDRMTSYLGQS